MWSKGGSESEKTRDGERRRSEVFQILGNRTL